MHLSTIVFIILISISSSLATSPSPNDGHDTNTDKEPHIDQRAIKRGCSASASRLLRSTPTPSPSDFRLWLSETYLPSTRPLPTATTTITTGPDALGCAPTDIPASLSSDFDAYRTTLLQRWYRTKSSSISRLLSRCSAGTYRGVSKVQTLAAMVVGECGLVTSTTAAATTAAITTRTRTSTRTTVGSGANGSQPTSSTSTGGAAAGVGGGGGVPMATGLGSVGGAVVVGAVVGVLGVVAF